MKKEEIKESSMSPSNKGVVFGDPEQEKKEAEKVRIELEELSKSLGIDRLEKTKTEIDEKWRKENPWLMPGEDLELMNDPVFPR